VGKIYQKNVNLKKFLIKKAGFLGGVKKIPGFVGRSTVAVAKFPFQHPKLAVGVGVTGLGLGMYGTYKALRAGERATRLAPTPVLTPVQQENLNKYGFVKKYLEKKAFIPMLLASAGIGAVVGGATNAVMGENILSGATSGALSGALGPAGIIGAAGRAAGFNIADKLIFGGGGKEAPKETSPGTQQRISQLTSGYGYQ